MAEAISDCDRAPGPLDEAEDEISEADAIVPDTGSARRPLGSLLTGAGHITEEQLAEGLREGKTTGRRLGEVVVLRGWVTEDVVAKLLAEQWALGYVERASIFFDVEALSRLSREQAQSLGALPTRVKDGRVVVAVAEPTEERLAALRAVIGDDTVVVVIPKTALDAGLRSELLSGGSAPDAEAQPPGGAGSRERRRRRGQPAAATCLRHARGRAARFRAGPLRAAGDLGDGRPTLYRLGAPGRSGAFPTGFARDPRSGGGREVRRVRAARCVLAGRAPAAVLRVLRA